MSRAGPSEQSFRDPRLQSKMAKSRHLPPTEEDSFVPHSFLFSVRQDRQRNEVDADQRLYSRDDPDPFGSSVTTRAATIRDYQEGTPGRHAVWSRILGDELL